MWTAGYKYSCRKMESGVDWAYYKKALPRKHFSGMPHGRRGRERPGRERSGEKGVK